MCEETPIYVQFDDTPPSKVFSQILWYMISFPGLKDNNRAYNPVISFGSWADAKFSMNPNTSITISGKVSKRDILI